MASHARKALSWGEVAVRGMHARRARCIPKHTYSKPWHKAKQPLMLLLHTAARTGLHLNLP